MRGGEGDAEPLGVDAGVGAARGMGHRPATEEPLEHALDFDLYRAAGSLPLPPHEPGAVELKRGEIGPAHRPGI